MKKIVLILSFAIFLTTLVYSMSDEDVFYTKCTNCHGTEIIFKKKLNKKGWKKIIKKMNSYGANVNSSERNAIIRFLMNNKK